MVNNKHGWIKVVEAVIALLLIAGTILVVVPKSEITQSDKEQKIYEWETFVLREIEINEVLDADLKTINLITTKKVIYVMNIKEEDIGKINEEEKYKNYFNSNTTVNNIFYWINFCL